MLHNELPERGDPITSDLLKEVGGLAGRPVSGAGVSASMDGISFAAQFMMTPVVFELKTSLSSTVHEAKAYPVCWSLARGWWTDYSAVMLITVEDGTGTITATGKDDAEGDTPGAVGWGMWGFSGTVLVAMIQGQTASLTPAILYDDVVPGDTGKYAWPCNADGTANTSADKILLANNHPGLFIGFGSSSTGSTTTADKVFFTTVYGTNEIVTERTTVTGKLDESLSVGGSAPVSVWRHSGSSFVDSGVNITARDWLMKTGATAIASGKKVVCKYTGSIWIIEEAECA